MGAYADKYADRLEYFRAILPPVVHPVVLRHPTTGRKTLFVNRFFTRCINDVSPDESDSLLDHLCRQAEVPEYQLRFHWEPGSIFASPSTTRPSPSSTTPGVNTRCCCFANSI